jgi:hypothetical protein
MKDHLSMLRFINEISGIVVLSTGCNVGEPKLRKA